MKSYRMNAMMGGVLYVLGTVFGILGTVFGGRILSAIITNQAMDTANLMALLTQDTQALTVGAFFYLLMGICLTGMTVFLYPVIKEVSEELALGMLLFRGALEGSVYVISTVLILCLAAFGNVVAASSEMAMTDPSSLQLLGMLMYRIQQITGPILTIIFLTGATCLYVALYKSKLIPRWLSVWGLVGVVPYAAYAMLAYFNISFDYGVYLQMILAPQEVVMGLWFIVKGFDVSHLRKEMLV